MRDDLRAAIRSFRSAPGFTVAALVVLTLGIGATTAIFSVVDAVVLRGLPFDEHDRLVAVGERYAGAPRGPAVSQDPEALSAVAPQNYADWVAGQRVFAAIAAIASGWLTLREPGMEPESLVPQRVTASFFDVLAVAPAVGRLFTTANETAGADRVAVLSDGLWRRRFGGDPGVIGRRIALQDLEAGPDGSAGAGYEVIGVMPPGFAYPVGASRGTDIWIPFVVPAGQTVRNPRQRINYLQVIARLGPGVSLPQAQAQMTQVAAALEQAHPTWNKDNRAGVRPLVDHMVGGRTRSWLLMLLGAVALVLLIACANIASLLLARSSGREREIAVRAALGASRLRLLRQLMIENVALAAAGTLCAVLAALWAIQALKASMPDNVPRVATIALDFRVLMAAAGLALVTSLIFGLVPALHLSGTSAAAALKEGGRSGTGRRQRLRSVLVVSEVALALVLLVGASLFIGSFVTLLRIDPGFAPDGVLTAQISPPVSSRTAPRDVGPELQDIVDRVARLPQVQHAAVVLGGIPLNGGFTRTTITIPGKQIDLNSDEGMISVRRVSADYHRALAIPLLRGRMFTAADRRGAAAVAIIDESASGRYFPGEDPVGRAIAVGPDCPCTIVGVVGQVRQLSLETEPRPEVYLPLAQATVPGGELLVRTSGNPRDLIGAVRAAVFAVMPDVPLRNVSSMEELVARRTAQRRLNMLLLGQFGLLGVVIAAVGVYGLLAFVVAQRTREIGVRMALGATRATVMTGVMLNAGALVGAGLLIGAVGAWYLSSAAEAFLFELHATDWRAYAAAAGAVLLAAMAASVIPARRAASVDPMTALRSE